MQSRTCLDCGLVTIDGHELTSADRVMLGTHGQSSLMPANPERTDCFKKLWVHYYLAYSGNTLEGVYDELERERDNCSGFFKYEPHRSPAQHLELENEMRQQKFQWRVAKLGFWASFGGALIGVLLPKFLDWGMAILKRCFEVH